MLLKTKGVNILQKNLKISLDDVLLFEAPPPRLLLSGSLKSQNLCPLVCARPNCVRAACNLKRSQDAELSEFDASEFAGASINPHTRENHAAYAYGRPRKPKRITENSKISPDLASYNGYYVNSESAWGVLTHASRSCPRLLFHVPACVCGVPSPSLRTRTLALQIHRPEPWSTSDLDHAIGVVYLTRLHRLIRTNPNGRSLTCDVLR
jgi:hypothetical protein